MKQKLVIFDCDGTLIDSQNAICAAMTHTFGSLGLPAPERAAVRGIIGLSLPEVFLVLAAEASDRDRAELESIYRSSFSQVREAFEEHGDPLYPGIHELVTTFAGRDDIVLGVATGKSKRGVNRLLDREGWHGHFFTIQTADDHPSKPHPSMILRAMADAGVDPSAAVMVGDTTYDITMALNAGVGAIGVGWGYHEPERLRLAGAHVVAEHGDTLASAIEARLAAQAEGGQP